MSRTYASLPPLFPGGSKPPTTLRLVQGQSNEVTLAAQALEERLAPFPWVTRVAVADAPRPSGPRRLRRPIAGGEVEIEWQGDSPDRRAVVELALDQIEARIERDRLRVEAAALSDRFGAIRARMLEQGRIVAIGTMAASVAHDIRSPLAVLVSNMGFLEQELSGCDDPDLLATLSDNRLALELIEGVLESMRTFVADRSGSGMVRLRPVVDSARRLTRFHFAKARIALEVDVKGDPIGRGSDGELCQVLMNLLSNAAQASPPERTVRLQVRRTRDEALIYVADDGPGVPPEAEATLFEPFHTSKPDGMGLGLAIARQMVRRHGGELSLLSEPPPTLTPRPHGACFELRLPARLG